MVYTPELDLASTAALLDRRHSKELTSLHQALEEAMSASGSPQFVLIEGEMGTGKSVLLENFFTDLQQDSKKEVDGIVGDLKRQRNVVFARGKFKSQGAGVESSQDYDNPSYMFSSLPAQLLDSEGIIYCFADLLSKLPRDCIQNLSPKQIEIIKAIAPSLNDINSERIVVDHAVENAIEENELSDDEPEATFKDCDCSLSLVSCSSENSDFEPVNPRFPVKRRSSHRESFAAKRVEFALRSIIRSACHYHPITIVLVFEDFQWIDEDSFRYLHQLLLLNDAEKINLLIVATSTLHISSSCPLVVQSELEEASMVDQRYVDMATCQKSSQLILQIPSSQRGKTISLSHLKKADTETILASLLIRDVNDVGELAQVVCDKTRGQPSCLVEFLEKLHKVGMIYFSMQTFRWEWNLARIRAETNVADIVAELIMARLLLHTAGAQSTTVTDTQIPTNAKNDGEEQKSTTPSSSLTFSIIEQAVLIRAALLGIPRFSHGILSEIFLSSRNEFVSDSSADNCGAVRNSSLWCLRHDDVNDDSSQESDKSFYFDDCDNAEDGDDFSLLFRHHCEVEDFEVHERQELPIYSAEMVKGVLEKAVNEGLLERIETSGKNLIDNINGNNTIYMYKFAHTRVRDLLTMLASKDPEATRKSHYDIGHCLKTKLGTRGDSCCGQVVEGMEDMDIDRKQLTMIIVYHLNKGLRFGRRKFDSDALEHVELIYEAALYAFRDSSMMRAEELLMAGRFILDRESPWVTNYEVMLKITTKLAEVQKYRGKFDESKALVHEVLSNAKSLEDKLPAYKNLSEALALGGCYSEAVELCNEVLQKLGVTIPRTFKNCRAFVGMLSVKRRLAKLSNDQILRHTPTKTNLRIETILDFSELLVDLSFRASDPIYSMLALKVQIDVTLQYGSSILPITLASCGYMCAILSDFDEASRLANLAAAVNIKNSLVKSKASIVANTFVYHWRHSYYDCLKDLSCAVEAFELTGDLFQYYRGVLLYNIFYFLCGLDLKPLDEDLNFYFEIYKENHLDLVVAVAKPLLDFVSFLRGRHPLHLLDSFFDNEFKKFEPYPRGVFSCAFYQMLLLYYFGNFKKALKVRKRLDHPLKNGPTPLLPSRLLFEGLIFFALAKQTGSVSYQRKGRSFLVKLEKLTMKGNKNCYHMVLLLRAELQSFSGDLRNAKIAYDKAIVVMIKLGYLQHGALANELAGAFFLRQRDEYSASSYLTHAHDLYTRWGAVTKAAHLQKKYCQLFDGSDSSHCVGTSIWAKRRFEKKLTSNFSSSSFALSLSSLR